MIFVDSNVFIYAVGRPHPLRQEARDFFVGVTENGERTVTSAEVLQELLHVYLPVSRKKELDAALRLVKGTVDKIFPIDAESVYYARTLQDSHPGLTARDLIHLACCHLNGVKRIKTFEVGLLAGFTKS